MTVLQCWDLLPLAGWKLTGAIIEGPPFIVTWRKDRKTLKMIDTLNFWRMPLSVLGEVVGLTKLERPKEWTGRTDEDTYCRRDVDIIKAMCLKWWSWLKSNDMGCAAMTIAGQALTTYRHRFLTHPIFLDDNKAALELSRDGYNGGRVECFRIGALKERTYLLDVTSMYPCAMERENYPTKLITHVKDVSTDELSRWIQKYCVVARVLIDTPEPCYPLRVPGYLLHPTGQFTTVLTTPELAHAFERGRVRVIYEAALYEHAPIFREYVKYFWGKRLEYINAGDDFGKEVTKLLLNSLYGKFGQRGWKTDIRTTTEGTGVRAWTEVDAETGITYRCRAMGGVLIVEHQEGESRLSHPAISAHVTGWGRMCLWDLIQTAGRDETLYCSTDSVLVTERGLERLRDRMTGDGLGSLRLVRKVTRGNLYGPNDYEFDGERKVKGVSKKAHWVSNNVVEQEMWLGLKSLVMRGHLGSPLVRHQTKTLKREYKKGAVLPSGNILPWALPGDRGRWETGKLRGG